MQYLNSCDLESISDFMLQGIPDYWSTRLYFLLELDSEKQADGSWKMDCRGVLQKKSVLQAP